MAIADDFAVTHRHITHDAKARLPQLDGIRGIAILMIVWWHYFNCQVQFTADSPSWLWHVWHSSMLSWSGVDLFFVLSGFLITGILLDHTQSQNVLRVFYLRRAARILPLYMLVLAIAGVAYVLIGNRAGFEVLFDDPPSVSSYLTLTQNIFMGAKGSFGGEFLGVTWSLAVEEQFYLVWPLVVLLCRDRRKLLWLSVVLCLCAPLCRFYTPGLGQFVNTPHRMDALLCGSIAALLVRNEAFVAAVQSRPRHLGLFFFVVLPAVLLLAWSGKIFGVLNHFVVALFYTVILLQAVIQSHGRVARALSARWLGWFGTLSYAIYLFHEPIVGLLHGATRGARPSINTLPGLGLTILSFGLVLVAAAFSMRYFETRFLAWGRRHEYAREEPSNDSKAIAPATACASTA